MRLRNVVMGSGFALVFGCGGSLATPDGTARDGGSVDHADSGTTSATDASSADEQTVHVDAATTCSVVRVPKEHRANAVSCPTARGAGNGTTLDAGPSAACSEDSDCTMGDNGRCLLIDWGFTPACSYDDCYGDSDCPGNVACACRASASDGAANVCASGSGCRLDSDCGPCGYCSPSGNPFFPPAVYFCHTADDACTDDSDCPQMPDGCQKGCNYDPQAGHWSCVSECPP
ncbi:MAG TPA: hypothetical protein VIJ22_13940 [Polyangiaceae bacterium]